MYILCFFAISNTSLCEDEVSTEAGQVQWYNHEHRHSAIRYVTPNQRHSGQEHSLLKQREAVYEAAKQRHPGRWSGRARKWNPVREVWLNPPKEHHAEKRQDLKAA